MPSASSARNTAVVVRDLCRAATRSVLPANYSFDRSWQEGEVQKSRALWQPLADNMTARPDLRVRFFINIARDDHSKYADRPAQFWIYSFVRHFREHCGPPSGSPSSITTHAPSGPNGTSGRSSTPSA